MEKNNNFPQQCRWVQYKPSCLNTQRNQNFCGSWIKKIYIHKLCLLLQSSNVKTSYIISVWLYFHKVCRILCKDAIKSVQFLTHKSTVHAGSNWHKSQQYGSFIMWSHLNRMLQGEQRTFTWSCRLSCLN